MNEEDRPFPEVSCPECGRLVPDGEFCGACGAHLVAETPRAAHRDFAYAAHPGEHLFHPGAISTLFPHLPHRGSQPFRIGLVATAAALLILGYLRLTGPAIAAAALCVPVLYLLYLYEVEVYEDEPVFVIAATFVVGAILGTGWALLTSKYVTETLVLNNTPQGAPISRILVAAVAVPLVAQALMLVGPAVMYIARNFDEALDGFTFGAAGAMGFALASTIVDLSPELRAGFTSYASAVDNTLTILERGLLIPFLFASITGLIAGAAWLRRGPTRTLKAHGWTTTLWTAVLLAVVVDIGIGLTNVYATRHVVHFWSICWSRCSCCLPCAWPSITCCWPRR